MDIKKLIATAAIAGTLVVGIGGVASAADTGTGSGAPTATATQGSGSQHPGVAHRARRAAFKTVLDQTNTTAADLKAALTGGQTVAQYADAHGSSGSAIHDALVGKFTAAIDQAVTNGKLTQSRADTMKQNLSARIDTFLNRTWVKA